MILRVLIHSPLLFVLCLVGLTLPVCADPGSPAQPAPVFSNSDWISLNPGVPGVNGKVTAIRSVGTNLYVAGEFTVAGNVSALNIARWDGSAWHPLGAGISGAIKSMVVTGGQVFVGGVFLDAGGVPANSIARWDGSAWHPLGEGIVGSVNCLEAFNGLVYAGGFFSKTGGLDAPYLAMWDGSAWSTPDPPPDERVFGLLRVGEYLYASGYFRSIGGVAAKGIARWDGNTWSALSPSYELSGGLSGMFWDGANLYAGGLFTLTSGGQSISTWARWDGVAWSGVPQLVHLGGSTRPAVHQGVLHAAVDFPPPGVDNLLRWNGSAWSSVGGGVGGGAASGMWSHGDKLLAGGDFTHAGGVSAKGIASFDGGKWSALGEGMDGSISDVIAKGGDLYVRGTFTRIGGVSASGIARWSGGAWSALGDGPGGPVSDMVFFGGDLVVCGTFGDEYPGPVGRIARWDGSKWSPFETGIHVGRADVLASAGGRLFVGGELRAAVGSKSFPVAEWKGAGWSIIAKNPGGLVDTLAVAGNQLYAALSSGVGTAQGISRWDGSSWTVVANGLDGKVRAMAAVENEVYVAGQFTTIGGVAADRIAKWDGSAWTAMNTAFTGKPIRFISTLLVHGGSVFAGGDFHALNGIPGTRFIAEWNGSGWLSLGTGMDGPVEGLAASDSGELYIAGSFSRAGETISPNIVQATNLLSVPPFSVSDGAALLEDGGVSPVPFGAKTVGQTTTRNFVLTNVVNEPITLGPALLEGKHASEFSASPLEGAVVPPGGTVAFTLSFNPADGGHREATFRVSEAAAGGVPYDLKLSGTGVPVVPKFPEIEVQHPVGAKLVDGKAKIAFPKTTVLKKGGTRTLTIRNVGSATLPGITVAISGKHKKHFVLVSSPKTTLAAGTSTTFKVRFQPKAVGKVSAAITIRSNDADENPFDINATGTGLKARKSSPRPTRS